MKKVISLLLVGFSSVAVAEDTPFNTHTELGYVNTSGNTSTESFALDFVGKKDIGNNSLQFDFGALYGAQDKIENNNRIMAELGYDYQFTEHFSVNYIFNYRNDKFSGYDYQLFTGPGIKYTALKGDVHNLFFQLNVVYSVDQEMDKYYTDSNKTVEFKYPYTDRSAAYTDPDSGEQTTTGGNLAKIKYSWKINESLKFIQALDYRGSWDESSKYYINSKTALESKISDMFSMGLSYKVAYANEPPAGVENTDKIFMASMIIDY